MKPRTAVLLWVVAIVLSLVYIFWPAPTPYKSKEFGLSEQDQKNIEQDLQVALGLMTYGFFGDKVEFTPATEVKIEFAQ